jgi:hypothetical protein
MTEPRCIVRARATVRELHLEHVAQWAGDAIGADNDPVLPKQPNTLHHTFYETHMVLDDDGLPMLRDGAA